MPITPKNLSPLAVERQKKRGMFADGRGLYLCVNEKGGKSWIYRYSIIGKKGQKVRREMGLGAYPAVSLADARDKAIEASRIVAAGKDPIVARDSAGTLAKLAKAREKTFQECAVSYIDAHKAGWRNAKHIWQWTNSLEKHVYPTFGDIPVQDVDLTLVIKVLEPIWETKTETASRIRGRIEAVLDWAKTREYRTGENPARWRGHLENLLAPRFKVQKIVHQPALPYDQLGDFLAVLKEQGGTAAEALNFTILTAARTNETISATWDEIDLQKKVWTIPGHKMKAGREHRIPLSEAAIGILTEQEAKLDAKERKKNPYLFTGLKYAKPLSNMAMLVLLRRMNAVDETPRWIDGRTKEPIVVHGFRSSFREWAAEQTNFPREVAEAALAHAVGDKVEAAYRRGDLFEKRRLMMDAWARYCLTPAKIAGNNVRQLRG